MAQLIEKLKQHIKAFNGDIYGNILTHDENEIENTRTLTVHCRLDLYLYSVFVQLLNLHFDMHTFPSVSNELMFQKQYIVKLKDSINSTSPSTQVILDVCFITPIEWARLPCDLDVHLLAENSTSVFLRTNYTCLDKFVDKIGHVKKRIETKKFTLLDASICRTVEKMIMLVDKSQSMIERGWIMDDCLFGDTIWNINKWITYEMRPQTCRVFHDKKKLCTLQSLNECPLCNEQFNSCDIVINTKCNHNFHWCNSKCKGLKEWVKRGNISCPVCRKNAL